MGDLQLAESLSRSGPGQREMGTLLVVLVLPTFEFPSQVRRVSDARAAVELVFIGAVAALDLAVALWTARRYVTVRNAEVAEMPGKVRPELGAMVGLNAFDRDRQSTADLVHELHGVL